jgi:hypothetical protein
MKDIYALYVDCSYGFYVIPDDDIMIDHMLADAMEFPWGGHYEIDEETFDLFMSLRELALL